MNNHINLDAEASITEYFIKLIEEASERQKFCVDDMVTFYMVNLLIEYVRAEKLYPADETMHEETLVAALEHAMNADTREKETRFKRLGDYTLFVSGFFHDSLNRSLVDVNYYIGIGRVAYSNLASIPGSSRKAVREFYQVMAKRFKKLVDVLSEVSDKVMICNNRDILRIYDRWVKTGSERDKALLQENGILPINVPGILTVN